MRKQGLAVLSIAAVLGGTLVAEGGPFARRMERAVGPAVDQGLRQTLGLDFLESLNDRLDARAKANPQAPAHVAPPNIPSTAPQPVSPSVQAAPEPAPRYPLLRRRLWRRP